MIICETQHLRLRTWQQNDFLELHRILSDPITKAHWPQPLSKTEVQAWLERAIHGMHEHGYTRWCCERLRDGQIVGDVGIMATTVEGRSIDDLGYIIHHPYWRMGYALQASQAAITWARSHGLKKLVATMATDNKASAAVARKLGMTLSREFVNPRNRNKPTFWFELELVAAA